MPEQTIFQKDRALAHYHIDGQDFLNEKFFGRWIGRRTYCMAGKIATSDPLHFFAWEVHQRFCVPGKSTMFKKTKAHDCGCSLEDNTRNAHRNMEGD